MNMTLSLMDVHFISTALINKLKREREQNEKD